MFKIESAVSEVLTQSRIKVRPNAHLGVWLMYLLPFSLILCSIRHPHETSQIYRLCSALSVGLMGTSLVFILQCTRKKSLTFNRTLHLLPAALTATAFRFWLHAGFFFSLISGLISSVLYWRILLAVLYMFPLSFTLGEAAIAAQALILFLYSTVINVCNASIRTPTKILDISTLIIQVGLCAIGLICILMYRFKHLRNALWFYTVSTIVLSLFVVILLHVLLLQSPILWIVTFLFEDVNRTKMVMYCAACSVAAAVAIDRQIKGAEKATPAVRKVFHIFAVAVFLPGLLYHCSFIYLASGVVFGIFVSLEMLGILNIPPLGSSLQNGFVVYRDEKDTGTVALTPLYLLVGCSLPVWIYPAPCDMLDSAGFNLLPVMSGVLAVGVGDTLAGAIGTKFGKHKWPGTKKTIEGTIGCICSQLILVWVLIYLGYIGYNQHEVLKAVIAIVIGSLVEAKTTQIDNIVLPLVVFIILC
ncbi:hypothetical protein ILUMI_05472 [Ignelater luminosus]|uniref:dolichol kinase n=1 Tax=Ignelater luminosus TaxID=2038154 RepID=A0A8K0GGC0_IGNLU|nr:hypothetical protein ILUMI_05472 [Ignelater luminosus]